MRLFLMCSLVLFMSVPAQAQSRVNSVRGTAQIEKSLEVMGDRYEKTLDIVRDDLDNKSNFYSLYMIYPKTAHYNPFDRAIIKKMEMYAFKVDTSDDLLEMNKALVAYNDLLDKHIANLGVLEFALKMTGVNRRLGSEVFLKKVRDLLIDIIDRPVWDGLSPDQAFRVISYAEEDFFLSKHNVTVKNSEVYIVGDRYYNVHDCEDDNGEYIQFYVDVTIPIKQVERLRELDEKSLDFADIPPAQ